MTHPLSGFVAVEDSARLIRNYRYAVERMMRILAGSIALTPELSAKVLLGRHVWDNAQHADALGRRLAELRGQAQVSSPAHPGFAVFMDAIEQPERPDQTIERLVGVYRVLKPHLLAAYAAHLAQTNEVYEPPTRRILARCAEDERRHIAAGGLVIGHLAAAPEIAARSLAWQNRLQGLLEESGGVTGQGLPRAVSVDESAAAESLSDDAREFIRLDAERSSWMMPGDLESAVCAFAEALTAHDPARLRRAFLPEAAPNADIEAALLGAAVTAHRVVAFAKVGRHRLLKLRLEGADGPLVLPSRWVPTERGWQIAAVDATALDVPRSG
jgi:hypothetical protein